MKSIAFTALTLILLSTASSSLAADPGSTPRGARNGDGSDEPGRKGPVSMERAEHRAVQRSSWGFNLEVDPTAYVFDGYSVHAGIGWDHLRLDLGVYAMDIPAAIHGNDGMDAHFDGFGAKLQWFPLALRSGLFVGIDAGIAELDVEARASGARADQTEVNLGINGGWRFDLPWNFYATLWLGLGYSLGADDMNVGGIRYDNSPITIFPAIHLGYRID